MTTRDDVIKAIRDQDARFANLRVAIMKHPAAALPTGTWTVRDALSHIAARSVLTSSLRNAQRRMEAARDGKEQPRIDINEVNHGQVVERQGASIEHMLHEVAAGHTQSIAEVRSLPEAELTQLYPTMQRTQITGIELLLNNASRHEAGHLNDIETALKNAGAAM